MILDDSQQHKIFLVDVVEYDLYPDYYYYLHTNHADSIWCCALTRINHVYKTIIETHDN